MRIIKKSLDQYNKPFLKDRAEGGKKLGEKLKKLKLENPVVLAIPCGGVPVGTEVAKALKIPFGLVIVRKIRFPWTTEAGFGAVAPDDTFYLSPQARGLPPEMIEKQKEKALKTAKQREKEFPMKKIPLKGKSVVLVDDGLATGSTMLAASKIIEKRGPRQIIVAVPTASGEGIKLLEKEVDQFISLYQHPSGLPFAVANSYQKWHDVSDAEVKKYLRQA